MCKTRVVEIRSLAGFGISYKPLPLQGLVRLSVLAKSSSRSAAVLLHPLASHRRYHYVVKHSIFQLRAAKTIDNTDYAAIMPIGTVCVVAGWSDVRFFQLAMIR
jgi:hypothetical protein